MEGPDAARILSAPRGGRLPPVIGVTAAAAAAAAACVYARMPLSDLQVLKIQKPIDSECLILWR